MHHDTTSPRQGHDAALTRLRRLGRRQVSSGWLIGEHRTAAGLPSHAELRADDPAWIRPPRPARCGWRVAPIVGVHMGEAGTSAHFSGLERCASAWACPTCAAVIRGRRALDLEAAAGVIARRGYGGAFITLTLRHSADHELADLLDLLMKSWRQMKSRRQYDAMMDRLGVVGMIRATEVTRSDANGWHPHLHVWLITRTGLRRDSLDDLRGRLSAMWREIVASRSHGAAHVPSEDHGVDVRPVTSCGISGYIAKHQDDKAQGKIGSELVRSDLKTGRASSMVPFELLDVEGADVPRARRLWAEYVAATKGRHVLTWSRGLREHLDLDDDLTDEQIIEEVESAPVRFHIAPDVYDLGRRSPQWVSDVLCDVEDDHEAARVRYGTDVDDLRLARDRVLAGAT